MHIGLFGLSGSGKTTLREEFCNQHPNFIGTSISNLLKAANSPIDAFTTPTKLLSKNQFTAVNEHLKFITAHADTITDMHAVIEISNGNYWVEKEIINSFKIDIAFFISCPLPQLIYQRSKPGEKKRKELKEQELSKLQNMALKHLQDSLSIPLFVLNKPPYINSLNQIIDEHTRS